MAIKIQTQRTSIPVEIGELEFEFKTTDENIAAFRKKAEEISKDLQNIEPSGTDDEILEQTKDVLRQGYDLILGDGAFDQIYEQTPSVMNLANYFMQLSDGINEELGNMGLTETQHDKVQKYLKNKKK